MKIDRSAASYLHAARRDSVSAPDPAQPSHRVSSMVAHRPLKFSTSEHDADFAAKRPSKDRKPKPTKSPEDPGFVPKAPKPPVTMPYSVNGYGTNNKGKGLYHSSNDQHHGSNRDSRSSRVDNRGQPTVYRHAPEPTPFDYRVHSENLTVVETRGKTLNRTVYPERARQKAKKKAAAVKKADQQWTFDSIISEALVENDILTSLLELEHKYLDEIDERIDGPNRFNKYRRMSREECVNTVTERRDYVRGKLIVHLQAYLLKRSTFVDDGRQHIHYCNFASTLRRFSGGSRNVNSPNSNDSVQSPPSGDSVTPPNSVLNPDAPPFQPASNNSKPSDGSDDNDSTATRINAPNSTASSLLSPIVRINNVYQSGVNRLDNLLSSTTFASVREAIDRASQRNLNSPPSPNASPITNVSPPPLIVATLNPPLPSLTMSNQIAPMNIPVNVQFAPQPPLASMPPPPVNIHPQQPIPIPLQTMANVIAPQLLPVTSQSTVTFAPTNVPSTTHIIPPIPTPTVPLTTNAIPINNNAPSTQSILRTVAPAPSVPTGLPVPTAPSMNSMPTQHPIHVRTVPSASVSTTQTQMSHQHTVNPPPTPVSVPSPLTPATNAPITALPNGNNPGDDDPNSSSSDDSDSSESDSDDDGYTYDRNGRRKKRKKKQRSTAKKFLRAQQERFLC
jgi:hypothetical protein